MLTIHSENVVDYAHRRGLLQGGDEARVERLAGGVSCEVLRLHPAGAPPFVIKQALPQLRVAAEWKSDPARMEHEVVVMRLAREALGAAHVPLVIDYDRENFTCAMESAPLDAVNWKQELLAGRVDRELGRQCGRLLAAFHAIRPTGEAEECLNDKSYFIQLRIEAYLQHSARNAPEVAPELHVLAEELTASRLCLTHADYTPKNFLVSQKTLILLDYEVSHVGHGVFDVASILNHLHLKRLRAPGCASELNDTMSDFLREYRRCGGVGAGDEILWRMLGALMLARVVGKSPVEYLNEPQKREAVATGLALLKGQVGEEELLG